MGHAPPARNPQEREFRRQEQAHLHQILNDEYWLHINRTFWNDVIFACIYEVDTTEYAPISTALTECGIIHLEDTDRWELSVSVDELANVIVRLSDLSCGRYWQNFRTSSDMLQQRQLQEEDYAESPFSDSLTFDEWFHLFRLRNSLFFFWWQMQYSYWLGQSSFDWAADPAALVLYPEVVLGFQYVLDLPQEVRIDYSFEGDLYRAHLAYTIVYAGSEFSRDGVDLTLGLARLGVAGTSGSIVLNEPR